MPVYPPTPPRNGAAVASMIPFSRITSPAPATTTTTTPTTPTTTTELAYPPTVTLAQVSGSALSVTWAAPTVDSTHSAATSYNLQYSPSGANAWTVVTGVASPYTLSGTIPGAAIDVQMQSVNAAGASAWSATSTMTTVIAVPNMPTGLTLAAGNGSGLVVSWTAPAIDSAHGAPSSFNLRYSLSGAGSWTTVAGISTPYNLSGLMPVTAYDIQVESSNAAGTSAWTTTATMTTGAPAPNVPTGLALAVGSGSNLIVTWVAPSVDTTHGAATSYNVRSSPSGAGTWTVVSQVASPYTLTGLTAGAAFDVEVQAVNTAGTSAWSAASTLTTQSATGPFTPNVPAITSVAPPADGTATKLTVTWSPSAVDSTHSAATAYNLRYSPTGAGAWTTVTNVTSPYTITSLAGASAFDIEVQASNAAANPSAWSAITTAKTWGATVVPGVWTAAATQTHGTSVAPNGGVQLVAVAAPTAVTAAAFAWSTSATIVPTSGLTAASADNVTNGWGQYLSAPATAGTYYLWMIAQGTGSTTIGALVTSAITVS